ncbi:hypothetical protein R3P38DRAFT_3394488 [Favolaschia claudopus]|uniref:Uncharacterized protein n=1 Tax=Favolaschia claudopus TaxID=2862362 RepID=A0AAW0BQ40_9AGAR
MILKSALNPSQPPKKRSSLFRFTVWIVGILGKRADLFLVKFFVGIGQHLFEFKNFAHTRIYQNQTLEEVTNRASVVRPLIDESQTFDIAVTVWTLPNEERDGERTSDEPIEIPLYSDIAFHGVKLADKHLTTTLQYKLPIAALFPLGAKYTRPQSIADKAVEAFSISMPLLEFHEYRSKCSPRKSTEDDDENESDESDDLEDDDARSNRWVSVVSDISKNPLHAVKRHPFVLTRTQIRIVDEVHVMNRKAYNKEHNKLKATSCGQQMNSVPDYNLCHRLYVQNGNWETRFELQIPDQDTQKLRTEWAYAPYIGDAGFSAGPKDIVPIPVTRERCTEFEDPSATDPEFIDIRWQISYTGRSPAKFSATEMFSFPRRVAHNDSDHKKAKAHSSSELWNGLYGHRFYEDAHPRRRLFIAAITSILSFFVAVLDLGYWYTRTSTAYISISGTILIASSRIIAALTHIANTAETDRMVVLSLSMSDWWPWVWLIVITFFTKFSLPLLMLKTVTRLELVERKEGTVLFFPSLRFVEPTHKERSSHRMDLRTTWDIKAGVCLSLIAIYYIFTPDEYHLISANIPAPSAEDLPTNSIARFHALVFFPLRFTGTMTQLLLNHRFKTFAGSYKAAVLLRTIMTVLLLTRYSPTLVGRFDARPGLSAPQVVEMVALVFTIWQALVFPKAVQKEEDDSE